MATTSTRTDELGSEIERDADELRTGLEKEHSAAAEALHDAQDTAREKARELAAQAREGALRQAEDAQKRTSASLHDFAAAVRSAGDQLAESEQGMAARFVREAANGLDSLSTTLAEKRFEEIIDGVRDFGRRNPAAFIAGSVLAGLAVGRFVRSTASDRGASAPRPRSAGRAASGDGPLRRNVGARPGVMGGGPAASPSPFETSDNSMSGRNQ